MNTPPEISYSLSVLLGSNGAGASSLTDVIHYGKPENATASAKIILAASGFFDDGVYGTNKSIPDLPLQDIEGIPLLFGRPEVVWETDSDGVRRLVVYADIVASAYFLLTRYEEFVRRNLRDQHGRFPGNESLPYRAGFLHQPIVEEYGMLLRKWLREAGMDAPEPKHEFQIVLTHDVDQPFGYDSFRKILRKTARNLLKEPKKTFFPLRAWLGLCKDPYDTFTWIVQQASNLRETLGNNRVKSIYFMMASKPGNMDGLYRIDSPRVRHLMNRLQNSGATLGLHASYAAGREPQRMIREKTELEAASGETIRANRHHYLCWREPEDVSALEKAGIIDDYTLGYADQPGFRLGVCRPVQYFEPADRRLTNVTVHSLAVMACTLDAEHYMHLSLEDAKACCLGLIETTRRYNGELVLLWHNTEFIKSYHLELYSSIMRMLKQPNHRCSAKGGA